MSDMPLLSVIIPCRNEGRFIGVCLDSVLGSDYPRDRLEVLVADGMSDDGTRDTVAAYAGEHPFIRLLDNPDRTTPVAINRGILASKGEAVIILGAHTKIDSMFLRNSVAKLLEYNVDCVGGPITTVPGAPTRVAQAIALALSSSFGIGNAHFRTGCCQPRLVDTVPYGCYRRDVFDRVGLFGDGLVRNQDIEFNLRLRRSGGKILLVPSIRSCYHAKGSLGEFIVQNFLNGFWVFYSLRFAAAPFSLRHLVPCLFVLSLLAGSLMTLADPRAAFLPLAVLGAYGVANLAASVRACIPKKADLMPFLVMAFTTLHISYGCGSLWGLLRLAFAKALRPGAAPAS